MQKHRTLTVSPFTHILKTLILNTVRRYCFAYLTVQTVVEYHDSSLLNIEDKKFVERNYHFIHKPYDQIRIVRRYSKKPNT